MVGTFSPSRLRRPLGPRRCGTVTAFVVSPQIHRLSGSALCFCVCAFARFLRFRVFAWWICRGGDLFADRSLSCGLPLLIRCRGTAQAHADAHPVNTTPYDGCEQTAGTGWLGVGFGVSARAAAGAATCWQSLRGHARRGRHRWRGVRRGPPTCGQLWRGLRRGACHKCQGVRRDARVGASPKGRGCLGARRGLHSKSLAVVAGSGRVRPPQVARSSPWHPSCWQLWRGASR